MRNTRPLATFGLTALSLVLVACSDGSDSRGGTEGVTLAAKFWPDFPNVAQNSNVGNHLNPMHNDSVAMEAPDGRLVKKWFAKPNYAHFNPCTSGPEGHLYCASYKDPGNPEGECNLMAIDFETGDLLWTDGDANGGKCLLDEMAFPTSPLVDRQSNVYAADSQVIVSYTADGELRWQQSHPADATANSPTGKANPAFGMNMLPTGELITGTLGDGFILVMDSDTGELLVDPFDLPADKLSGGGEQLLRPPWMLEKFGGESGAQAVWDSSFADTDNENDNDISVDGKTGLILVTSAAEAPNDQCEEPEDAATPCGDGKLWALQYNPDDGINVRFSVRFEGPGGSATTPGVSHDGNYVVIGNNKSQALVVDIPGCFNDTEGVTATPDNGYNECTGEGRTAAFDLFKPLLASPTITPDNRVINLAYENGIEAFDITGGFVQGGPLTTTWAWTYGDDIDSNGQPVDEMPAYCNGKPADTAPGTVNIELVGGGVDTLIEENVQLQCVDGLPARLDIYAAQQAAATDPDLDDNDRYWIDFIYGLAMSTFTNSTSVITAYNNVTYFAYATIQPISLDPIRYQVDERTALMALPTFAMVAVDTHTGDAISITYEDVGDLANVVLAADEATVVTNNFFFVTQNMWDRGYLDENPDRADIGDLLPFPVSDAATAYLEMAQDFAMTEQKPFDKQRDAGVRAYVQEHPELPISGDMLEVSDGSGLSFRSTDYRNQTPTTGTIIDPRSSGATASLFNPDSGESEQFDLAANNWSYDADKDIFMYRDDSCEATLGSDQLDLDCGLESFALNGSQGSLGVSFYLTPLRVSCALFSSPDEDGSGSFKAGFSGRDSDCKLPG